jgi:hypothetical protein
MAFAPTGAQGTSFGFSSTNLPLPTGGGAVLRVANLGPCHISIVLGGAGATVTQSTGVVVMAGQVEYFTVATQTNIAGVACGGPGNASTVNLSIGAVV